MEATGDLEANGIDHVNSSSKKWWIAVLVSTIIGIGCSLLVIAGVMVFIRHRTVPVVVEVESVSESPISSISGVRPFNITWDVTFRFSQRVPFYTHLYTFITWTHSPCPDPIVLADTTLPDIRQATHATATLLTEEDERKKLCASDGLFTAPVWHLRLELHGQSNPILDKRATMAPRLVCTEFTLDAANSRMVDQPIPCTD